MDYTQLTDEQLQAQHANCQTTAMTCTGHFKADRNYARAKLIKYELNARNLVPDNRQGTFNGEGAY